MNAPIVDPTAPTARPPADALDAVVAAALSQRGDALLIKDLRTARYVYAEGACSALLGRPPVDCLGRTDAEIFDAAAAAALRAAEQTSITQAIPMASEHALEIGGRRRTLSALRVVVRHEGGPWLCSWWSDAEPAQRAQQQLGAALQQIEQHQRANEQLRRELAEQAMRDQASGLHSHAHFDEQLRRELDLSTREHREFAVVYLEVDPPGDAARPRDAAALERVLEAVGRVLRGGTRAMDASCRMEGGSFAVLLSGVGLATAHSRMEGLRRQCATQIVMVAGEETRFSVSMGVSSFPHTASDREQLLAACQSALQQARQRGGNQVVLASIRFEGD